MKLHFARGVNIPIDALMQPIGMLGNRGSGKTYALTKLFEEAHAAGVQCIGVDIVGKFWALRLGADGHSPGLTDVYIFGGRHADFPLQPEKGAFVAKVVVEKRIHAILDLSQLRKGDRRRFLTDFFEELHLLKKAEDVARPCTLFIEEAHAVAPQKPQPDEARMLGAIEDLVREGRNAGIGVVLNDQRPATVNKNVIALLEVLVALRTTYPIDRKVYEDWVVQQGVEVEISEKLPFLGAGEGFLYAPVYGIFEKVQILPKKTYDASATAKVGGKVATIGTLTPVDREAVGTAMAEVIAEAEQSDPKALRRRVAELEREVAKKAPAKVEFKEVPVLKDKQLAELEKLLEQGLIAVSIFDSAVKQLAGALKGVSRPAPAIPAVAKFTPSSVPRAAPREAPSASGELGGGPLKLLQVLARNHLLKVTRAQLGTLSGYTASGGTFGKYFGALKRDGLLQELGDNVSVTPAGMALLGTEPPPPPQTTEEVLAIWRGSLELGPRTLLDELVKVYPDSMSRGGLGGMTGYTASGGTFGKYLGILKRNGLVELEGDQVRASPSLFLTGRAA